MQLQNADGPIDNDSSADNAVRAVQSMNACAFMQDKYAGTYAVIELLSTATSALFSMSIERF